MTTIPLFTSINYARPRSYTEGAISTLSNYFYLGGNRATVIRGDEVRLEVGKVSWYTIALKVASYVLLFPLTLTLLAINLGLRYQHNFTVISPSQLINESNQKVIPQERTHLSTERHLESNLQELAIQSGDRDHLSLISNEKPQVLGAPQKEPEQTSHSVATVVAQTVENVRRQIITPPPLREKPFKPFIISISEESLPISSKEDMRLKAQEVGQQILDKHIKLRIDIPSYGTKGKQALKFIEELKTFVDIISTRWANQFYIVPKMTEEFQEGLTIRKYNNGIVEEVQSSKKGAWGCWQGRRIYPNGVIETGKFDNFCWHSGICVEKEVTTYRLPNILVKSHSLDRGLMYAEIEGKKQLIVIHKKSGSDDFDYVQINEELIPTLAKILEKEYLCKKSLQEILSESINCEEFFKFLFETNFIFFLREDSLEIVLKIIQERRVAVNLRQQHPKTKEILLNCHSKNASIKQTLLAIDPTLINEAEPILLKQFKKKLKFFSTYKKDSQQIATELFKNIPKGFELAELVNFIFKECGFDEVLSLLDAILIAHPSFTLSPYDKIRRAIVEDKHYYSLTNSSLIGMLKEHNLDNNEEKVIDCYDLAYRLGHPYIYPLSQTSVLTSDYSLNFLWVNLNPQDRIQDIAQNIFKDGLDPSENATCM